MTRFLLPLLALILTADASIDNAAARPIDASTAVGIVFEDANGNGQKDAGEKGLPDVRVSNGRDVVKTDEHGAYRLSVTDDTILFVIKPRGWIPPLSDEILSRFYYVHKPAGSPKLKYPGVTPTGPLPKSVDFALRRHEEPSRFKVLLFGDTQPSTQADIDYLAHDVIEELVGTDAAFGVTLGDLTYDSPALFESVAQTIGLLGVPWYHVLGNHDMNYDAPDDALSTESYQRVFGPPYYAFDFGPVHFIVLDDVVWKGASAKSNGDYTAGLGERQLAFVRNDLALLPKEQLVVLMMHIPLMELAELRDVLDLLERRPHTFSVSAHYHYNDHHFFGKDEGWDGPEPHHHLVNVTTCGSWWRGVADELGIPHTTMRDGAPNGYAIATFDGCQYAVEYRPARRPAAYQIQIHAPEMAPAEKVAETEVLVNVFAGSDRSKVEMRVDDKGAWLPMTKTMQPDPFYLAIKKQETKEMPSHLKMPAAIDCPHLWKASLPTGLTKGKHLIHVRTVDVFGQAYDARRVIRIE